MKSYSYLATNNNIKNQYNHAISKLVNIKTIAYMKNVKFNNYCLNRDIKDILENGTDFRKGTVSGNSIEYMEGNSFCSLIYYDDENARDEDLKSIEELLNSN